LVRETLSGNTVAFETIIDRYANTVFGLALAHLRHWNDAEDATQEVFATAYQSLHTLRDHQKFPGWLATMARNRCRRILKRRGLERALPEKLRSPQQSTLSRPEQDEVYRLIHHEMDELPTDAREVLLLYYFSKMRTREIAQRLGISRSAVAKRLQRARQALGERLLSVLGKDMQRRDHATERKTYVMGVIAGLSPEWMSAAGGSAALKTAGAAPLIIGVLLMKKTIFVALVLALGALGYFALPHDGGEKPEPTVLTEIEDASPETVAVTEPPTLAKSEAPEIEAPAETVAPHDEPLEDTPDAAPQTAALCEISDPSRFASVSGTVRDEDGNPVAGVEVLVICHGTGKGGQLLRSNEVWAHVLEDLHSASGVSNSSGAYHVKDIPFDGPVTILASGDGYAPGRAHRPIFLKGQTLKDVDLVVESGTLLLGRVTAPNRGPVAKAAVRAPFGHSGLAFTGDDGRFELTVRTRTAGGVMFLKVSSPRYGTESFNEVPVGTDGVVELVMRGSAVLRGHLAWRDGSPGTGARVRIHGSLANWNYAKDGSRTRGPGAIDSQYDALVNAAGDYVIEGIDVGQFYYLVTAANTEGEVVADGELGFLEPNRESVWNAVLDDVIIVFGKVLGQNSGEPILNARINVSARVNGRFVRGAARVAAGKSYHLELPALAGQYLIVPSYQPFGAAGFEQYGREIFLSPGDEKELDLYFPEPFSITIRVVNESGTPVSAARVKKNTPVMSGRPAGETDEDGRFVAAGIMPNIIGPETTASLTIEHPEYPSTNTRVYVGEPGDVFPEETVVLYRASGLMGRIVDPDGQPLEAEVWVKVSHSGGIDNNLFFSTDDEGFFENESIPATNVTLSITAMISDGPDGRQTWDFASVDAIAGSVVDLGELIFDSSEVLDPEN
jgi:RNA polymerase sigma-70 factor (ECF subfamily)